MAKRGFISDAVAEACPNAIPEDFRFEMDDLASVIEVFFHDIGIIFQVGS